MSLCDLCTWWPIVDTDLLWVPACVFVYTILHGDLSGHLPYSSACVGAGRWSAISVFTRVHFTVHTCGSHNNVGLCEGLSTYTV